MLELTLAVIASIIVSSITLFIVIFYDFIKKYTYELIAFSTGVFLGAFFLGILPKIFKTSSNTEIFSFIVMLSFLTFFIIENFMHFHHHGEKNHVHSLGILNLIGDFFHNFMDGLAIAAAFKVSIEFGVIITLTIAAHELPQEFGDFSILLYSGFEKWKAVLLNFLVGLSSLLGVIIGFFVNIPMQYLLSIVAGSFLYIGASDLIPLLKHHYKNKNEKIKMLIILFLGLITIPLLHKLISLINSH
ncbi:MAG: ZIP family metal transporter [Nanoarchaeota archaeon]